MFIKMQGLALYLGGKIKYILHVDWSTSMLRLDPRNCWRQLSYTIKNQLGHPKPSEELVGGFGCDELVLYGIRKRAGGATL